VNPPVSGTGGGPGADRELLAARDVPPPGADLMAAMNDLKPVRTRRPRLAAAVLALASLGVPAGYLMIARWRTDLGALPMPWVVGMAVAWAIGLGAMLLTATLPRRGEVLPDTARAGRTTLAVTALLILLGLLVTVDAPGKTYVPPGTPAAFAEHWWHCVSFSLKLGLPLLVAGGLLLRRLFPMGGARVAAALGGIGGAAAGLALHFTCQIGGGLHVGLAHGGGVAVGALLGMLLLPRLLRN
jgi:hypothetical protein